MLPIAGQTAEPIGPIFLWKLVGGRGCYRIKKFDHFFQLFFKILFSNFFSTGNAGTFKYVFIKPLYTFRSSTISKLKDFVLAVR